MADYPLARPRVNPTKIPARKPGNTWQGLSTPLLLFFILPLLALILRVTPGQLLADLGKPQVLQAIGLSLATSLTTTLVTVLLGTPVAHLLSRQNTRFTRFVDSLIDLPTVLPPAVAGVALLMAFGRRGLLGSWLGIAGFDIAFTQLAVVMAQLFIAAPYFIKSATVGFSAVNDDLRKAAALDGANGWEVFRYVTAPLAWKALLTGAVMTWARALGEFGATIIFAGNLPGRTQTMPLAIYIGFEIDLNIALTLSVILVGVSFLTLILVKGMLNRKSENYTCGCHG
jgi:molybdate transport system permease protein